MYSEEQKQAITTTSKNTLVAAAAGSGKTTVIVGRINYLIEKGVDPSSIYAITYTNMAAQEMLSRINYPILIGTMHSLANSILQSNGVDTSTILKEESFNDLIEMTKSKHIEMPKITHLLVDELQDISDVEFDFIVNTLKADNLYFVGDSCQAIYGFKGGNYNNFMDFANESTTSVYELTTNYRNPQNILTFGNKFLRGMGDMYRVQSQVYQEYLGEVYEEKYSLENIINLIQENKDYKNWFVLGRKNSEVQDILNAFQKEKIPCSTFKKSEKTFEEVQAEMEDNKVKVLTIHSAKGLETNNVIVIGAKQFNNEEKRVCYVAATRAKEKLYWMTALKKGSPKKTNYHKDEIDYGPTVTW